MINNQLINTNVLNWIHKYQMQAKLITIGTNLSYQEGIKLNENNYSYLSGHICVHTENTYTHYASPYYGNVFSSENDLGKITLFPSWIEHYTDQCNTDLRITIAFDILDEVSFNVKGSNRRPDHWEKI